MKLKIEIAMDNAAFGDNPSDRGAEIRQVLQSIPTRVEFGYTEGNLRDTNGNTVGTWKITGR